MWKKRACALSTLTPWCERTQNRSGGTNHPFKSQLHPCPVMTNLSCQFQRQQHPALASEAATSSPAARWPPAMLHVRPLKVSARHSSLSSLSCLSSYLFCLPASAMSPPREPFTLPLSPSPNKSLALTWLPMFT